MKAWFILFFVSFYSCMAFAAPDNNPAHSDQIKVVGTLPEDVEAILVEEWYTTTDSMFCQHMVGEAGFMSNRFARRSEVMSASNTQRSWIIWRDEMKPGYCGWALKQIVLYLDSRAYRADPVRASNIPTRVAKVCGKGENCENTWSSNDDSEKPTYHRCKFSSLSHLETGESENPCVFFDEKVRGTDFGKYEHILRLDQHTVRFVITEIANQNP